MILFLKYIEERGVSFVVLVFLEAVPFPNMNPKPAPAISSSFPTYPYNNSIVNPGKKLANL
jgi:hypothetical protein